MLNNLAKEKINVFNYELEELEWFKILNSGSLRKSESKNCWSWIFENLKELTMNSQFCGW
jgi:hypothetical protein